MCACINRRECGGSGNRGFVALTRPCALISMAAVRHLCQRTAIRLRLTCSPQSRVCVVRGHRLGPFDDEQYRKTSVSIMQKEASAGTVIYSYSPRGFNINGNTVFGPCAVLPPAILQWNVGSHSDISVESLSLFYLLEPQIEVLVLGTGARTERLHAEVLEELKKRGIAVEVQDTPNACATFNFLSSEKRLAAAALIPPPAGSR